MPLSDNRPGSVPALELISRAASSVGVMYRSHGPNTGSNPGGGQIPKKNFLAYLIYNFARPKRLCGSNSFFFYKVSYKFVISSKCNFQKYYLEAQISNYYIINDFLLT